MDLATFRFNDYLELFKNSHSLLDHKELINLAFIQGRKEKAFDLSAAAAKYEYYLTRLPPDLAQYKARIDYILDKLATFE